ncbi:MAG: imidazole glycerol phosphate synthase subunit HisH [bacterium]|nr:imidazole glycerol phosphate synthase subunit HisH [bacterium]
MSTKNVAIIDYFAGNIYSVTRAFEYAGCEVSVVTEAEKIMTADCAVLPGVGAFGDGMSRLKEQGMVEGIREFVQSGKPFLGICLGMQMLFSSSEEFGQNAGLDLVPGQVTKLPDQAGYKIPHIGWNPVVVPEHAEESLWEKSILASYHSKRDFYFVHSFAARTERPEDCLGETLFGDYRFCSVVRRDNIMGTQFHPEKSKAAGMQLIENFLRL